MRNLNYDELISINGGMINSVPTVSNNKSVQGGYGIGYAIGRGIGQTIQDCVCILKPIVDIVAPFLK